MDAREVELRQAVLDAPDDLGLRLVYADHLQEHGEVRGEHIALACAQDGEDETREMRRRALWQHHGARWRADDGVADLAVTYRHGFVEAAQSRWSTDAKFHELEQILARHPLRRFRINALHEGMSAVARSPLLAGLHELDLGSYFNDSDATYDVLAAATHVSALWLMSLTYPRATYRLWGALDRWDRLAELESLDLSAIEISDVYARVLSSRAVRLKRLSMGTGVRPDALAALAEHMPALDHLELRGARTEEDYRLRDPDLANALAAPWARQLMSLSLQDCPVLAATATQIARLAPSLVHLELVGVGSPNALPSLLSREFPDLETLDVSANGLTDLSFITARRFPKLTTLRANRNPLTTVSAIDARAPKLRTLELDATQIGNVSASSIARLPLQTLVVSSEAMGSAAIGEIVASVPLRGLRVLEIGTPSVARWLLDLADAPFDKLERLELRGVEARAVKPRFNEGWLPRAGRWPLFERRLELTGAAVTNARVTGAAALGRAGETGAAFDPSASYEVDELVTHPEYGVGMIARVEPICVLVDFPGHGFVQLPLRPGQTAPYDPDPAHGYAVADIFDHPEHGVAIVTSVEPEKVEVRLATGGSLTIERPVPRRGLFARLLRR